MILGIGTDIMEVERVRQALEKNPNLREDIFTPHEISYCESKVTKYQHYTARFAAKEALMKALGAGLSAGLRFSHIEIRNNELGKPSIILLEKAKEYANVFGVSKILVSLAHIKSYATAMVVIEGNNEG